MHALCCDAQMHQAVKHLALGHLLGETFAISHHNTYYYKPAHNPEKNHGNMAIGDMLAPHFINLIAINGFARDTLIAPINAILSVYQGVRGEDFPSVISKWFNSKPNLWSE